VECLRKKHLQSYLDEFVFRFNRRKTRRAAFRSLLGTWAHRLFATLKRWALGVYHGAGRPRSACRNRRIPR
jgi:hypothetical protein